MKKQKPIAMMNPHLNTKVKREQLAIRFALSSSRIEGVIPSSTLSKKLKKRLRWLRSLK